MPLGGDEDFMLLWGEFRTAAFVLIEEFDIE